MTVLIGYIFSISLLSHPDYILVWWVQRVAEGLRTQYIDLTTLGILVADSISSRARRLTDAGRGYKDSRGWDPVQRKTRRAEPRSSSCQGDDEADDPSPADDDGDDDDSSCDDDSESSGLWKILETVPLWA